MSSSQINIMVNAQASQAVRTLSNVENRLRSMGATHAATVARTAAAEFAAADRIAAAEAKKTTAKRANAAQRRAIELQEVAASTAAAHRMEQAATQAGLRELRVKAAKYAELAAINKKLNAMTASRAAAEQAGAARIEASLLRESLARSHNAKEAAAAAATKAAAAAKAATAEAAAAAKTSASLNRAAAAQKTAAATTASASKTSAASVAAAADTHVASAAKSSAAATSMSRSWTAAGSRLQWIGKQMSMHMTVPLALLAGVGVKAGLDLEKAMTRVAKVYGDMDLEKQLGSAGVNKEIEALERNFVALSNRFGENVDIVAQVGAAWAAAGSSGKALANQTQLTMEAMILGEMEAEEATSALIAIQAQWSAVTRTNLDDAGKLSTGTSALAEDKLSLTTIMRQLNMVENETATKFSDLVKVFQRASSVARDAGVSTGELAAMTAALVPAAGTAEQAGTSLKTMISKLFTPTKEATEILGEMGIQTDKASWTSLNAVQKMKLLAKEFKGLTGTQRAQLSATMAGRYQINRFQQIMHEVGKDTGYFSKALQALSSDVNVVTQAENELNAVLDSNPQKLKQAGQIIRNSLMKTMVPLIPIIIQVTQWVGKLFNAFSNLSPEIRTMVLALIVFLAALGPVVIMAGLFKLALGSLMPMFAVLGKMILLPLAPLKLLNLSFLLTSIRSGFLSKAIAGLGLVMRAFGVVAVLTSAVTAGAWYAMFLATRSGVALQAVGWLAMRALWVANLVKLHVISAAGWASLHATWVLNWAILRIKSASAWTYLVALDVAGWARKRAVAIAGSISLMSTMMFMWRGIQGIFAAGVAMTKGAWAAMLAIQKAWGIATTIAAFAIFNAQLALQKAFHAAQALLARGALLGMVRTLIAGGAALIGAISWPWVLAIGIVVGLIALFKDQIVAAFRNVVAYFKNLPAGVAQGLSPIGKIFTKIKDVALRAFNALPDGIKSALLRVVAIIRAAALKIYELFSYINPFARHSPSLVENVNNGMSVIDARFRQSAKNAQGSIASMHTSIKKLQSLSAGLVDSNTRAEQDKVRSNAREAGVGNAIPEYNNLAAAVAKGKRELEGMNAALEAQKARVAAAQSAVARYDDYINKLNRDLATMQATQDSVNRALDGAKARYDRFSNAQIAGSRAAEDAIFANTMAQKKLQLQIKKMEEEAGTIGSVSDAYSKLQGDIEKLTAKQTELRRSGAGSDILSTYDKMIGDLKAQQAGLMSGTTDGPAAKINQLNEALERLKSQAETMELEKSLQFDQLNRNIEQFKSNVEEMPYGQIMSGMDSAKTSVNALQLSYDSLGYAMDGQNARIAAATQQRDRLQAAYDAENKKLEGMQKTFDALEESIRSSEQAMQDFASAAEEAIRRAEEAKQAAEKAGGKGKKGGAGAGGKNSPGTDNFIGGADADFATFGGDSGLGREGFGNQAGEIDDLTKGLTDELEAKLGGMNPFAPLMKWWDKTVEWFNNIKNPLGDFFGGVGSAIKTGFDGGELDSAQGKVTGFFSSIGEAVKPAWEWIKKVGELLGGLFGGEVMDTVKNSLAGLAEIWEKILPPLADLGSELWELGKAIFPIIVMVIGSAIAILKVLWSIINQAIGPVFSWLGDIIASVIDIITGVVRIITGVVNVVWGVVQTIFGFFKGLFTGDWSTMIDGLKKIFVDGFGKILKGVGQIIWALVKGIWSTLVNGFKLAIGVVWGFIKGVINFFVELWDVLVGHSIIPDTIKAIIEWFKSLPGKILSGLWSFIKAVVGFFLKLPGMILTGLGKLASLLWGVFVKAFTWLVTNGPQLLVGLLAWVATIPLKIFEFLGDIGGKLLEWLAAGWNWLVENGPSLLLGFAEWLISIPGWIFSKLGDIAGKLLTWMKNGWDFLVANAPALLLGLITWLATIPLKILGWLGSLGGKLVEWMGAAWNWLVDNLPGLLAKFWNWVKGLPGDFIKGLGKIGEKLGDWLSTAWGWVVDNAPKLLSKLWEWLKGLPGQMIGKLGDAGKMLFDYGKNMIQGLIDGAGSLLKKIGEFMLDKLPGWIKGPFKKAMGIASPSKVFKGYGNNLGEGLVMGMEDMTPQIEAASNAMAESAKSGDFTQEVDVVANADTSSAAGAVSAIGSTVAAGGDMGTGAVVPTIDTAAASLELTTFIAQTQAQIAAFALTVNAAFASIGSTATLTFTNINLVATAQMSAMVTSITSAIATLSTAVQAQLALLLTAVNTFGTNLAAAWAAIWLAFGNQVTNGVNLTLSEWDRMALGMTNTLDQGIRPVFDEMELMLENMENSFARTVDNVGTTWDGIREKTAAPARFVINDVYNDGIRGAWNKFNEFLDLEELPEFTAGFAAGGAVYGRGTSTSDSIPARLSKGEHVITAAEVRAAGGHHEIYRQRAHWRNGKSGVGQREEAFRNGGPVGDDHEDPHARQGYAPGGTVQLGNVSAEGITTPIQQAMWDAVRTAFPQVVLHSATRTVDVGSGYDYHMQGMALDVSPSPEIARWIYEMNETNPVLELIHWPLAGWQNLKNGAPLDYGPGTNAGHMDHVHWAMNTMVDNEGKVVSMGPMGAFNPVNYKKLVEDGINTSMDEVLDRDPKFGGGIGEWVPAAVEKGRKELLEFLGPKAEALRASYGGSGNYGPGGNVPYNLSAGVEQWRKLATEMLIMQGQSATYTDRLLMQMNSESSGNPNAINLVDINAQNGVPSKGLMQVIDPTFARWRDPRLPDDIWDPAANIAASIRYTVGTYGTLDRWDGTGYDSGGILPPGFTLANNQTGGPEAILTAAQWSAMFDIATKKPLEPHDVQDAVENANIATGNTGDKNADAIIKGMDVWSKGWTPAMYDAVDASANASKSVSQSVDQAKGSTVLLSKSIGKYNDEIAALSKLLNAISASAQQSYKVTVNTATGETTKAGDTNVRTNEKGQVVVDVEGPSFSAWAPTINAVADLLDAMPYAERDWDADNPVAGETERERKARIAQNNMTNYTKGLWNVTKDVGPPLLRHTAIIGAAAERLIQEDGTAWTQAVSLIASGNQLGWFILVPLILKTLAVMLPLILAAILDIVPALIRAIVRFLTQFMPDSVYAYADMGAAEAAAQEQYDGGDVAQGQGRRYPTDAMRTNDSNAPVNLYMYGDLVMPNVSDGSDANEFVDQLKLLASN